MSISNRERTEFVPAHVADHILPNNAFVTEILRHAERKRLAIKDVNLSVAKTYEDLLSDAVRLRVKIRSKLSERVLQRLKKNEEVYIGLLAPGGYEFTVGFFALLSLGAVIVPLTVALPVQEAVDFVHRSAQVALVTSSAAFTLGDQIREHLWKAHKQELEVVDALTDLPGRSLTAEELVVSSDRYLDDNAAGAVIFTSGTTGRPKAAVLRRGSLHETARTVMGLYDLQSSDVVLHVLPVHHVTGVLINFLPFMLAGACIEFKSGGLDTVWIWNRWRDGGLTIFSGVPTIYMRMMRYYDHKIKHLPQSERRSYDQGVKQFRSMLCGTSALPRPLQNFWTELRGGDRILVRYGSTEMGVAICTTKHLRDVPDGSVGVVALGADLKLAEGDEGEILVKSPSMFSKYLFNEEATREAHDEEGFFKTGDLARREGKFYYILGRASQDIIKSGGYKISALDIEREILGLPYVSEVMVVGVDDAEFGQRVGAVVTLREDQDQYSITGANGRRLLTLDALRDHLSDKLARYKLPTLLRVARDELPKTASGKVSKKQLGPQLFPTPGYEKDSNVQVWTSSKSKI